jgi:hypothetical protein
LIPSRNGVLPMGVIGSMGHMGTIAMFPFTVW